MEKELYDWLEIEFYKRNIKKYHKYFKSWVENLTIDQIQGQKDQMIGQITQSKIKY